MVAWVGTGAVGMIACVGIATCAGADPPSVAGPLHAAIIASPAMSTVHPITFLICLLPSY
jgi:hypothetical protein